MSVVPDFLYHMGGVPITALEWSGVGDVFYVASSGSTYETKLLERNLHKDEDYFHTVAAAYAACTANHNDVVLVAPEVHTQTARINWAKDKTHLIGLGGPNVGGDYSLACACINTTTASIAETIDIDADRCMFINVLISNGGNNAANLTAVNVNGWGNYFKNVTFQGIMTANQSATEACCSLSIDYLGHFPLFENCIIGQNQWGSATGMATANQGHLRFIGATFPAPVNGRFIGCQFLSWSQTSTTCAIRVPGQATAAQAIDRVWLFKDCSFHNIWTNYADNVASVILDSYAGTHTIQLKNCDATGFDGWGGGGNRIYADMPITGTGGGLTRQPTGAAGD